MSGKRPTSTSSSSPISTKWAVGVIAALIAYALLQPVLNKQLGWQLPALANLQQGDTPAPESPGQDKVKVKDKVNDNPDSPAVKSADTQTTSNSKPAPPKPTVEQSNDSLRYGLLRETSPDDFLSPGGLRYTRGSAEGHRLNHLERHLEDDPGRPGKHGVFDGDMGQVIRWIDEAYALAKSGAKGSSKTEEDGRMVYEASFSKPLGYIGGRDGRRDNNPDARRLRLVVEGNKVITAFPF